MPPGAEGAAETAVAADAAEPATTAVAADPADPATTPGAAGADTPEAPPSADGMASWRRPCCSAVVTAALPNP